MNLKFESTLCRSCLNIVMHKNSVSVKACFQEMEDDFFITEYISNGRSELKCTIKKLYSDFIVNEITPDGIILGNFKSHLYFTY